MRRPALALLLGCLLLVAGASALDGYGYYQTIEYAACDQDIYQQDIVIHRTTGDAYNETAGGLETWHIFVGEHCREDYGDIRFTSSTGELAYYLWPDYNSSSARFCVRLEGADAPGSLTVWYGNAAVTTTSDGDAVYEFFDQFDEESLDTNKWKVDPAASATLSGGSVTIAANIPNNLGGIITNSTYDTSTHMAQWGIAQLPSTDVYAHWGWGDASRTNTIVKTMDFRWGAGAKQMVVGNTLFGGYGWPTPPNTYSISRTGTTAHFISSAGVYNITDATRVPTGDISPVLLTSPSRTLVASFCLVRAYSATPPAATTFSGEQLAAGLQPFPGLTLIPRDLAGTGLYTDINGNNRLDYNDLTVFFQHLAWAKTAQPIACFDFNGNGWLDYNDVITLFTTISGGV